MLYFTLLCIPTQLLHSTGQAFLMLKQALDWVLPSWSLFHGTTMSGDTGKPKPTFFFSCLLSPFEMFLLTWNSVAWFSNRVLDLIEHMAVVSATHNWRDCSVCRLLYNRVVELLGGLVLGNKTQQKWDLMGYIIIIITWDFSLFLWDWSDYLMIAKVDLGQLQP